jgi:hypothetical protein
MGSAKPVSIPKTVSLSRPRPNLEYARPSWVAEGSQMGRRLPNLNCEPPICVSSTGSSRSLICAWDQPSL